MSHSQDWTAFTLRIHIAKAPEEVYKAWATPAQLTTWFLDEADYYLPDGNSRDPWQEIQTGDSFKWKWHNWPNIEEGTVVEANGTDYIKFTFAADSTVEVHMRKTQDKTLLELTQNNIPTDDASKMNVFCGCNRGWSFWMTNLKAWLEHKILLNDISLEEDDVDIKTFVNS